MIQSLSESNRLFWQQILASLPIGIFIINQESQILYFNLLAEQITGYSKDEIVGKSCHVLGFTDCQIPCSFFQESVRHNPRILEGYIHHRDGHKLHILRGIYPLKNDHGQVVGAVETLLNNRLKKRVSDCISECLMELNLEIAREIHLRRTIEGSKNKLLGIFDEIIDGLLMIDHEYKIKAINKTQAFYLNKTPKELIENYCYQVVANRESPCPTCKVSQVFQEGVTKADLNIRYDDDCRCFHRLNDNRRYVNIHYIPIKTELSQVHNVLIYIQNISKLKELEEGVRRAENLASLGILASGVAHEINNPLQVILSGAKCLVKKANDQSVVLDIANQIKECAEKMANIIKDLSLYSRGIREHKADTLIEVQKVLEDSVSMALHVRNMKRIIISRDYQPMEQVLGNARQFQQIFVNLIINAVDAMEGVGEIILKTFQEDDMVCVNINDSGPGIREEDLPYIFDPFFTTKDPGKGTGLGLNVVYRLVNDYKGNIQVETRKGEGTSFILRFPRGR